MQKPTTKQMDKAMGATSTPIEITYFSDILCVWAYAAEVRLAELHKNFGEQIVVKDKYSPIFADNKTKIEDGWADRGGYDGFAKNLQKTANRLGYISVHEDVWTKVRPTTSTQAHLLLKALQNLGQESDATEFAHRLRHAFFANAKDISNLDILFELASEQGLDIDAIKQELNSGKAQAALEADHKEHIKQHVKGSPTYIMNDGRQILFGNVGYRILEANINELLHEPTSGQASWC